MALKKPTGYHELPQVPLENIFKYLCAEDLSAVQYVCENWKFAAQTPSLWNIVLLIKISDRPEKIIKMLENFPQLKHITSEDWCDCTEMLVNALLKYVSDLKTMNVTFSPSLSCSQVAMLMRKFTNLESITLCFFAFDLMESLYILKDSQKIKEVKFAFRNNVDMDRSLSYKWQAIRILADGFSKLERIDLTYLQRIKEEEVLYLLEKKSSQLKSVTATYDEGNSRDLLNLITGCINLEKLVLESLRLPHPILLHNLQKLKSVRLILGQILNYETSNVSNLTFPPCLERLEVYLNFFSVQPSGFIENVITLPNLKFLKVSNFNDMDVNEQLNNISCLTKLETLILCNFPHFSEQGLKHISKCRNLRNISLLRIPFKNTMLEPISNCSLLQKIKFTDTDFPAKDFLPVVRKLKYITDIHLPDFSGNVQEFNKLFQDHVSEN